jgi:hypothetical protein
MTQERAIEEAKEVAVHFNIGMIVYVDEIYSIAEEHQTDPKMFFHFAPSGTWRLVASPGSQEYCRITARGIVLYPVSVTK